MTKTDLLGEEIQLRAHGSPTRPALVYLPGLHGDWTLVSSLQEILATHLHFIEITYPRTVAWGLPDYGAAVRAALLEAGVSEAWLLAESFSSQVGWEIIRQDGRGEKDGFRVTGLILAGGFLRHPVQRMLPMLRRVLEFLPTPAWKFAFRVYAAYGHFRHRHAPETRACVREFVQRRTPNDIAAILHRLDLIAGSDYRQVAREMKQPVYALSGVIDPIVPWWHSFPALKRSCPTLHRQKLVWPADHNVLGTEPARSARIILEWMGQGRGAGADRPPEGAENGP